MSDESCRQRVPIYANSVIPSTILAEHLATAGYDGVVLDLQHGDIDRREAITMAQIWQANGAQAWARVPDYDRAIVGRLLDGGITGVIRPMVETAAQAREHVEACLFPPLGKRSFGPMRRTNTDENYFDNSNARALPMVQVESTVALENLEGILGVAGVAGVYIGPADLNRSMGLSLPLNLSEGRLNAAIHQIINACRQQGKLCGTYAANATEAAALQPFGLDFLILQTDLPLLVEAAKRSLTSFKGLK